MVSYVVRRAAFIETAEEARDYYRGRLVGDAIVAVGETQIIVRFNPDETHLYSEELRPGSTPSADKLVRRGGHSAEVRVFSKTRARLLDEIIPTIERPVAARKAKIHNGVQLIGPPRLDAGQRFSVVVALEARAGVFFVRTAFPMSPTEYRRALAGRPEPWPPKE